MNIAAPCGRLYFLTIMLVSGWISGVLAETGGNQPVDRIVSLAPHLTELAYAAGAGDKLVGTVEYSDFPSAAVSLQRIGDAFRIDYERVALLKPDLVLAWGSGTAAEIIARLRALGYRVIELEPDSIESIAAELRQIGELAGTRDIAEQSAVSLLARSRELQLRYGGGEPRRVFFQISAEPLYTVSGSHVISEIIEDCGGVNVFADAETIAPAVSKEAVVAAKPDVILAASSPGEDAWTDLWRSWQQIPAVSNGHLFGIDRDLITRSGPRILDGALQVCEAIEKSRARFDRQESY